MKLITIIIITFAISGCITQNTDGEGNKGNNINYFVPNNEVSLEECNGFTTSEEYLKTEWKNSYGSKPLGWSENYQGLKYTVATEFMECGRIGWGNIEEGPTWIAIEIHNRYMPPSDCIDGQKAGTVNRVVSNILSNSKALVSYLLSIDSPASFAEFYKSSQNSTMESLKIIDNINETTINFVLDGLYSGSGIHESFSFFWIGEKEVLVKLSLVMNDSATLGDVSYIDIQGPFITRDRPSPRPVISQHFSDRIYSGEFEEFSNTKCEGGMK